MNIGKLHVDLEPLSWLIGEWKSITAVAEYPTMRNPVHYNEDLSFISLGRPFLNYKSLTWHAEKGTPMHLESGFLHVSEDAAWLSFLIAQSYGVATVEEGVVKDKTITLKSSNIGHMKFVRKKVVSLERCYKLNEKGQLEYTAMMETVRTPLTRHITVVYEKCA